MHAHAQLFLTILSQLCLAAPNAQTETNYAELRAGFESPDHAQWGEVPLWWWEGQPVTKERITAQLKVLAAKGVKSVCPIQRSPGRCDPQSFTEEYWQLLAYATRECERLGMTFWAYDQVGYGHYGWLEKAAAHVQDPRTHRVTLLTKDVADGAAAEITLPEGQLIAARAYPLDDGVADDARSRDVTSAVDGNRLTWKPPDRRPWRVTAQVAVPFQAFYLSKKATDAFIDMFYGEIERRVGSQAMGKSFAGVFQDEHPPTPRDIYTKALAQRFREHCGYEIGRAIPALHFDVGPVTPQYRTDFFDVYLALVEQTYWKPIYDWTWKRNVLTSHDNWGRNNIVRQSAGYIDYFRSQRWFSAPGYDDSGQRPVTQRNYYDTKIASSIARLYGRPRVWNEAFHSSGWGRSTDQTLSWLSAGMAFGANLYDEHGLYYATNASTWEHAAPDPHWRQPYWVYYQTVSDFVARSSYLCGQGKHVVDAAVHYPVVSLLAGARPGQREPDYNGYMALSRAVFDAGIDNDIADDDSILGGVVKDGAITMGGNAYQALVFGPEVAVRRGVLEKALALVRSGGTVLFFGRLPLDSTDAGRDDSKLAALLEQLLGVKPVARPDDALAKEHPNGGYCGYIKLNRGELVRILDEHIDRDFVAEQQNLYVTHRTAGGVHLYLVMNTLDGANPMKARFRVDGVPEIWDPFTGKVIPVDAFERRDGHTHVEHRLEGNTAYFFVFREGPERRAQNASSRPQPEPRLLDQDWTLSVIPTRDNRWGEFRWPPSKEVLGPEVRSFRYVRETLERGLRAGWHKPGFDDAAWRTTLYSTGPYWLVRRVAKNNLNAARETLQHLDAIAPGAKGWDEVRFSQSIGLAKPVPWGGHSGYPDGHIDKEFVSLPKGRKLLFTRIRSDKAQRRGLRVELRNDTPRLWVNGAEQPFEDAVGNLPLKAGENAVLLDLPNGERGRLTVQAKPPSIASMAEAARGMVRPDITKAAWVWSGDTQACYVRKTFRLDAIPEQARIVVSAYSGFRLWINGKKIEEEIGPWANWRKPESFTITPHLREGENVVAVWGQLYAGQNVNKGSRAFRSKGIVLALKMRHADGSEQGLVTDATWRGAIEAADGWVQPGFDDSAWSAVRVCGEMGDAPWGLDVVKNVGVVTEPRRPLSVELDSPYLVCFDEVPGIVYDVEPKGTNPVGWFRFKAPPGLAALSLPTEAPCRVWVDGVEATVRDGQAVVAAPPKNVSTVAIRVEMRPGAYAGAVWTEPLAVTLKGGTIRPGPWTDYAMPTYSGICAYTQRVNFTAAERSGRIWLDLGDVRVAAEVLVNGKSAGVRVARPFKFELTDLVKEGANTLEVRVANTIAPHYTTIPSTHLGPTESGLMGPVRSVTELAGDAWAAWATREQARLRKILDTSTPALEAAQQAWEPRALWHAVDARSRDGVLEAEIDLPELTGLRLAIPRSAGHGATESPVLTGMSGMLTPLDDKPLAGRTVRIAIPDRAEYLALAEVQVFSRGKNVARDAKARQSSTSAGGAPQRAIDGNTNGHYFQSQSVSHTANHKAPWWEVDLGKDMPIERIVIWNRTDGGLQERLRGFVLTVRNSRGDAVFQHRYEQPPDPAMTVHLGGPRPLVFRDAAATSAAPGCPADRVLDGNPRTGWAPRPQSNTPQAIFVAIEPQRTAGRARLKLHAKGLAASTTFDLAVTASPAPLHDVPAEIAAVLSKPAAQRSPQQRAVLAAFYRRIAPELVPVRDRLRALGRLLEQQ